MSIAELLKPRFKDIASGATLKQPINDVNWLADKLAHPELFKPLNWWERRNIQDMPKYLKVSFNGHVIYRKIEGWEMKFPVGWFHKKKRYGCDFRNKKVIYIPITEEEYLKNTRLV